jgi:hypothetical protein
MNSAANLELDPMALLSRINTDLADGQSGTITAAKVRQILRDITESAFDTRAAIAAASVDTVANDGPSFIRTSGYATVGDGGAALYKRLSGAPSGSTNKGYVQSADGAWWGLVPKSGRVRIEQFGGNAGYVNTGTHGTDNYQPILDATSYQLNGVFSLRVDLGQGKYWVSQFIEPDHAIFLYGTGNGSNYFDTATVLYFPNTTGGFIFHASNTGSGRNPTHVASSVHAGASDSIIKGFGIFYEGSDNVTGVNPNEHAIQMHIPITVENIWFHNVPGDAINIYANGGFGNANHFTIRDCQVHSAAGHGLRVEGGDTNAGNIYNFYTHQCGKCGIMDDAYLGNHYFGLEIDGYGNKAIWNDGKVYQQIAPAPRIGVAPGADQTSYNEWVYMYDSAAADTAFPAWDSGHQYTTEDLRGPIMCYGPSEFYSVYAEFGIGVVSHAPSGLAVGGTSGWTQYTPRLAPQSVTTLGNPTGLGSRVSLSAIDPGFAANGSFIWSGIGGALSQGGSPHNWPEGNIDLQIFEREADGRAHANYDNQNNITWTWGVQIWSMTGPNTTTRVGPGHLLTKDLALQDPGDSSNLGVIGIRSGQPIAPGLYLAGSRYFTASGTYVVSTEGGIAGGNAGTTWFSGSTWGGGDIVKNSAGRYYRLKAFVVSTVEPTHTSGTVTETDGGTWTYLTSADVGFTFIPNILAFNDQGGSYTLVLADARKDIEMNSSSAVNLTVPPFSAVPFAIGTIIEITQLGTGQVTVVPGSGVTLRAATGLKTRAQYSVLQLRMRNNDDWVVSGDMAA